MPEDLAGVLASPVYAAAFEAVMSGTDVGLLPADQREVLRAAQLAAGVQGPGYPMPVATEAPDA